MLRWWVPLLHSPLFVASIVLGAVGGLGMVATALRQRTAVREDDNQPDDTPGSDAVLAEYGAEGAVLRLLGCQLRESVEGGHVDDHLLAAAEWALDRHRARAIRLMRAGLGNGEQLEETLGSLVSRSSLSWQQGTNGTPRRGELRRLLRLIEAVASGELQRQAALLLRHIEPHPHDDSRQVEGKGALRE